MDSVQRLRLLKERVGDLGFSVGKVVLTDRSLKRVRNEGSFVWTDVIRKAINRELPMPSDWLKASFHIKKLTI